MKRLLAPAQRSALAVSSALLAATLVTACGGGAGGFPVVATPDTSGNTVTLSSFESGESATLVVADGDGKTDATAATVEASTSNVTAGAASLKVTLKANPAKVGFKAGAGLAVNWTGFRTLLVDVTTSSNMPAANIKLTTKSGSEFKFCDADNTSSATQIVAGATTTLAFRLDWAAMQCNGRTITPADIASVSEAYISLPGSAGTVVHLDNLRMTRSVRVMAVGDSITAGPGCWREKLWSGSLVSRTTPPVDMVGIRNNASNCPTDLSSWDADFSALGGLAIRSAGSSIGLADGNRDQVITNVENYTTPGNLPVWLEKTRPDMMVLNLGTNDVWGGSTNTDAIVEGFGKMVDQARASNPAMRFVVGQIPQFAPSAPNQPCPTCATRVAELNTAIEAWAKCKRTASSPITLADLTAGWNPVTHTGDGVHPNTAGHALMASNWSNSVKAALDGIDAAGSGPDASCGATTATDLDNGATTSSTFTITSFKTGTSVVRTINIATGAADSGVNAEISHDTSASHATEGANAATYTIKSLDAAIALGQFSTGGLADWSAYRFLKFDVTTGANAFTGKAVIMSGGDFTWCEAAGSVNANSSGTITLDLSTCGGSLADPKAFMLWGQSIGTYYVDNIRLEKAGISTAADLADANTTSSTFTITSFQNSTSAVRTINIATGLADSGVNAEISHDTSASHATEGANAATYTIKSLDAAIALGQFSTGGLADWSAYRFLKFDVTTGANAFTGKAVIMSGGDFTWCEAAGSVNANSSGTITLDLSTCGGSLADPKAFMLWGQSIGTYYVDNIRLEKAGINTAADLADANTTSSTKTITSFQTGVSSMNVVLNSGSNDDGTYATLTHDTSGSNASEGTNSAAFTITGAPSEGWVSIGKTTGGADWTGYKYLKFDIKTGSAAFAGPIFVQSGAGFGNWCQSSDASVAANSSGTATIDLSACGAIDLATIQRYGLVSWNTGVTYYIDNIRLTTE